ncbi:hydrolase 1, exosortase A system-associated [Inhella sp.]|uniref:hydrolase 1, exosortase A system-associated n=1 Tax=Inhella sp. TaxID=1921806 RepID=UPI0035B2F6CF
MLERVVNIDCQGERLTGVLAEPAAPGTAAELGVLIVVGGPQYRAGSHRQFVLLARRLAEAGFPCLRFDVRGMGDSGGQLRSFEALGEDIAAALDALHLARPGLRGTALWGLCDGASAALLQLHARPDPRVAGVCLVNPWVRSPEGLARTQLKHYYLQRLMQGSFWRKLLSGQVAGKALRELWQSLRLAWQGRRAGQASAAANAASADARPFPQRMAAGLAEFKGPALVLLSSEDYTAKEFADHVRADPQWVRLMKRSNLGQRPLPGADHTCSDSASQCLMEDETLAWLRRLNQEAAP